MNTQARSKSPAFLTGEGKTSRKIQIGSASFVQVKNGKLLFTLTELTWIVSVFVSVAFYIAVRNAKAEADWLACILLGMVFLGWIMLGCYVHATGKPVRPVREGDRHEK